MKKISSNEMSKRGGEWLGRMRSWIQCKFRNGEDVTWGSVDALYGGAFCVADLESLAADIAASAVNEDRAQLNRVFASLERYLNPKTESEKIWEQLQLTEFLKQYKENNE